MISINRFSGACHQNDRDRTREFLISWIKITSRKQPWFDKVRANRQLLISNNCHYIVPLQIISFSTRSILAFKSSAQTQKYEYIKQFRYRYDIIN